MQAAVLYDEWLAVDTDDVVLRECLAKLFLGQRVSLGIVIGRHQYSSVHDEEVGVCGRQSVAIIIVDCSRQGQSYKMVGFAVEGTE